jgi:hypothetical protein
MSAQGELVAGDRATFGTLDETFKVIAPHVPRSLVSRSAFERVLALTRQLPAALTRFAYIECRLAAHDPRVDVIFDITDEGRRIIAGENPVICLPEHLLEDPAWQRIRQFCREWLRSGSQLHHTVRSVWLEFDLAEAPSAVPVPGIFVRLEGGLNQGPGIAESAKSGLLRDVALPLLLGRALEPAIATRMQLCCDALPAGGQLTEAGLMFQRSTDSLRLCFRKLPEDRLPAYLQSVGWNGDPAGLVTTLNTFSDPAPAGRSRPMRVGYLDLDIGHTAHPTIGLEYFLERPRQLVHGVAEKVWLDQLVAMGLCAPEKRAGVLQWPGYSQASFAHELWPSIVVRYSNHIKLVHSPDQPLIAKAYLYFFHRFHERIARESGDHGRQALRPGRQARLCGRKQLGSPATRDARVSAPAH